jgi:hypothetical protein
MMPVRKSLGISCFLQLVRPERITRLGGLSRVAEVALMFWEHHRNAPDQAIQRRVL